MTTKTAAQKSRSWSDRLASRGRANREKEADRTRRLAINAAATLQLVGAENEVVERVANEILDRGLTDDSSGGTADTLIGRAVIETITGQPAPAFSPRAGEVARALLDAQATLQLVGIDETDEARKLTDRIVREGLRGARAKAAVREVVGPVVKQVEAAQQGGSQPTVPAETTTSEPRQPAGPATQDLPRTSAPAPKTGAAGSGTTPMAGPGAPAPAEATQAAPSHSSPNTGNGTSSVITGTFHNITNNADGSGTYDVTITYPDGSTEIRHITVNADGSSTITRGDGTTESYPPGSTAMPPNGAEGQAAVVNQDSDGDGKNDSATIGNSDDDDNSDDGDDGDGDDGDGDATGNGDDESQNQGGDDGSTPNESSEDQPAASSTPNPEREEAGSGFELQEATGGRLGGDAARRQKDRLDQLGQGGGAAGPEAGENEASGVLLTPEERANASRLLGVKAGGGITTPSPLKESSTAITERDLKDLVLRGNGGAGTPEVTVFPVLQPPQSPLTPPAGVPGVGGDPITGLGAPGTLQSLPTFQRLSAFQRSTGLPGEAAPPASTSATLPLGAAGTGLGLVAPQLFGTQAGGLVGAEVLFGGLAAFQAAPLLA